jgi:hypothetical protein
MNYKKIRFVNDGAFIAYPEPKIKKNWADIIFGGLIFLAGCLALTYIVLKWIGYF